MRRLALALLLLAAACKPRSLELADELDRSSGWLAAVAEVGRATTQNRTPLSFAGKAIEDASDELTKSASSLAQAAFAPDLAGNGRRLILASVPRIDQLRSDLETGAVDVHGNIAWFRAASDTLSDLGEQARKRKP